ncbi:MAG: hypothetical protein ABI136_05975 [Ginsengibacter sp.]
MIKTITFTVALFLFGCAAHKKVKVNNELPSCLRSKIDSMAVNPGEGMPQSVTRYYYLDKTVYYLKSPCCDKYNIVFDSACHILGYPDGGFTGRGDGNMGDFFKEAKNEKVVWETGQEK